jgi:2-polyprenyl-6-methoxyphenol hydroxylase-like FAD-dependent oxidoreductase
MLRRDVAQGVRRGVQAVNSKTAVLIIGGGPVGLALAVELGWRGIACTLVEQTDGTISTPKMNEVNVRTMEFCRRWGIAEAVQNCPFPADYPVDVVFVTNLAGYELGRVPRAARNSAQPEPFSPARFQVCSQIWFDPILRSFAGSLATVELLYRHRLEDFEHSETGVVVRVVDLATGVSKRLAADYMVGCDGANSVVRAALGIELVGAGTIGHPVHMFFRKPNLLERFGRAPGTFFFPVDRDGVWGSLRVIDPANGLWRLMVDDAGGAVTPQTVDRESYLRRALGCELDVDWLGVSIWHRRSVVAERYSRGRVFLAGDAVHQLSPTGALGMNSGIGDAVDLGWKLAATIDGWGGPRLLSSYDAERRPIGERNVKMATRFYHNLEEFGEVDGAIEHDSREGETLRRRVGERLVRDIGPEFRTIGLQIGYRYEDSPICLADGTAAPPDTAETYMPSARPGARAPHAWLPDGRSILDLFGRGFVLLRFGDAPPCAELQAAAASRAVPLTIETVDDPDTAELYQRRLVLVRPDGHVAWRSDSAPSNPERLIEQVGGA